jgi:hypothetical protein
MSKLRGKPRRRGKDVRKLIVEPRREHSRKPDDVRERIERLVGGPFRGPGCTTKSPGRIGADDQPGLARGVLVSDGSDEVRLSAGG